MGTQVYNAPLKMTRPVQAAPPIHLIRQALYDSESLMPTFHSNNPAERAAQMTANYERLILGLGVSPRGQRAKMRLVPPQPGFRSARGFSSTLPSLKPPRPGDWHDGSGAGTDGTAVALSRVVSRLHAMAAGGAPLSDNQLARLKTLSRLEGSLVAATEAEDPEALMVASRRLLAWLDTPGAETLENESLDIETTGDGGDQAKDVAEAAEPGPALGFDTEGGEPGPAAPGVRSRVSSPGGYARPPPEARGEAPTFPPEAEKQTPLCPPQEVGGAPAFSPGTSPASSPSGKEAGFVADSGAAPGPARPLPPPPGRVPSRLTKPNRPMNVLLLRQDLQRRLRKHWDRVMELFVQWDVNGDGHISETEFTKGLLALGIPAEPQSVDMLFLELERGPGGQVSFTELNRAIRTPNVLEVEKKRRAGGPVTVAVPITRESYAASKAEKAAREAAMPAMPAQGGAEDAEGVSDPNRRSTLTGFPPAAPGVHNTAGGNNTVWERIEGKLAPDGTAAAPAWQKEVFRKAKLQVEKRKLDDRRALAAAQMVAFWGTPKVAPEVPCRRDASIAGVEKRQDAARQFAAQAGLPVPDASSGFAGLGIEIDGQAPADIEPTLSHKAWLREQAERFQAEMADAEARRAAYASATAALVAEAAQLDTALEEAAKRARASEPVARRAAHARALDAPRVHREKKQRELQLMQRRANDMVMSTEKLVEVIDCLRNVRARHIIALRSMAEKEKQLDADGATLLSSAHYALEEHERSKAKHSRLRYEADATVKTQLRDGTALREAIEALDAEGEALEAKLTELDVEEQQRELAAQLAARDTYESRGRRIGALTASKEAWAREFGRIADKTGIWLGDAEKDAVEQVIAFYTEREEANVSLFRMTNSDLASEIEQAERDLASLAREEDTLLTSLADQAARDASGDNPAARRALAAAKAAELEMLSDAVQGGLADVMPLLDTLCVAAGLELTGDLAGQRCSMSNIDQFLVQIEARLLELRTKAHTLAHGTDGGGRSGKRAAPPAALALLGGWTAPVTLSRAPVLNGSTVKPKGVDEIEL